MKNEFDVCIVGAGVSGATMAAYLGKNGIRVAIVEKNMSEQERIVGELLQPGGVAQLEKMGLASLLEGFDAQPIEGYALFHGNENFSVSYPKQSGKTLEGKGFRNGKFLQTIRQHITTFPTVTIIEAAATDLVFQNQQIVGVNYSYKNDETKHTVLASLTIVCDGMFSNFRQSLSANTKKVSSYFLGMVLKNCELPFKNHGHVILGHASPCLVYPISSEETRVLIDFPGAEPPRKSPELVHYLEHEIASQMPPSIRKSFLEAVEEGKFKVMPNHYIPATPNLKEGAVLLGDSLNMRHPLTGGGMTAAFSDINTLGSRLVAIKNWSDKAEIQHVVIDFYANRHLHNSTINILADALYGVMGNEALKIACFDYLKQGGLKAEEPISILSAVSRDRLLLLRHFFAVAMFGAKNSFKYPLGWQSFAQAKRMMKDAIAIVAPLINNERPNMALRYALKLSKAVF